MAGMNMHQMMKQARKMQEQLAAAQEHLKSQTVDASAGGGGNGGTADGHAPGTARRDSRDRAGAEAESAGHVHFPGG